jgi:hypothetical protein
MEVLKQKEWSSEVECTGNGNNASGCGSILKINKSDIRFYGGKSGDPSVDGTFFSAPKAAVIKCPVCKCLTDLTEEQRPADYEKLTPFSSAWKNA